MFEERMKTGGREREERRKRGIPGRWEEVRRKTVVVRGCTEAVQPGEATGDNDGGGEGVGAEVGAEVGAATGAGVRRGRSGRRLSPRRKGVVHGCNANGVPFLAGDHTQLKNRGVGP